MTRLDGATEPREAGRRAGDRPARRFRLRAWATIAAFLLPALVLFCLLVVAPILLALYASLFKWNGFGVLPTDFIGLDNFTRLFEDEIFLGDLWRGLLLIVLSVGVQLPLALGIALLLNQPMRGRAVYRLLFFAPYVVSEVIAAVLFTMVFSPEQGLANRILTAIGLEGLTSTWLADPSTVMYTLFIVMTWKYFGFYMIIFLAGRQAIPSEVTEAAAIDGANTWQIFRHVTLPLLGPTIRIGVFLSVIGTIQLFDLVWVLTGGGPIHTSETLAVTMFQYGFARYQVGYASAISVVMFIISLVFALGYQRWVMRRDIEGAITGMKDHR
ncbi:sugar ABC transporter permease [Microtetraspora sp. NBRC 13810]|uniref:carbohydrate ABC transporter permease n=1 Tax=Microtetraspora sp. NBRC 13810 TaxID=3030990 RepID=UPI0025547370|nr:sugar ABC transporter permease [Microtetraspora sp. NBRC 13810]